MSSTGVSGAVVQRVQLSETSRFGRLRSVVAGSGHRVQNAFTGRTNTVRGVPKVRLGGFHQRVLGRRARGVYV